jgi:hypothetical protein
MVGRSIHLRTAKIVLDRFPDRSEQIFRLYDKMENIRAICDELVLAVEAIEHFEGLQGRDSSNEIADFSEVIENLEGEMIKILNIDASKDANKF